MKKVSVLRETLIFAVVVVASCAVVHATKEIVANKGISRGGPSRPAGYAKFKTHKFSYLNITILGESLVERGSVCALACLETAPCFSFNLAAFPDVNAGKLSCELLPSDKYNSSNKFVHSNHFHHFSIVSPCSSWPCKDNGNCLSQYEENSYVCDCKKGFTGKNCETEIDECVTGTHNCSNDTVCKNTNGGFNCTCKAGFTGNGHNCTGFSLNSKIISNNEFYLSNLSMFLSPAVGNDSKWLLCYRASTQGWNVSEFHSRCDGKNHTVTIIKVKQYIFGGYTDIPWESSGGFAYTSKAFIFSLSNKEDLKPFKSKVKSPEYAIMRRSGYGPVFGYQGDIAIADQANSNSNSFTRFGVSYSVPSGVMNRQTILAGSSFYTPDDWEVFYLA